MFVVPGGGCPRCPDCSLVLQKESWGARLAMHGTCWPVCVCVGVVSSCRRSVRNRHGQSLLNRSSASQVGRLIEQHQRYIFTPGNGGRHAVKEENEAE